MFLQGLRLRSGLPKPRLRRMGGLWFAFSGDRIGIGSRPVDAFYNLFALPFGNLKPAPLHTPSVP